MDDGALLRLLDGQSLPGEDDVVRPHVARCAACTRRLEEIRERVAYVENALGQSDVPVVAAPLYQRRWVRLAAAAVLLGIVVGVSPVRGLIVDTVITVAGLVFDPADEGPAGEPNQDSPPPSTIVSFVTDGAEFVLEITAYQQEGALTVQVADVVTATARVIGDMESRDLIVLPAGLRIVNGESTTASYVIELPATLNRIRVVIAGEPAYVWVPSGEENRWKIRLVPP